jgi:S-adenosylmethionine:tRNA ribosyltransferase-isomerase
MNQYALSDYQYELPDVLIAQEAVHPHHNAKMMVIDGLSGNCLQDTTFLELNNILTSDDIIFFNNSRVVRSRIPLKHIEYTTSLGHR